VTNSSLIQDSNCLIEVFLEKPVAPWFVVNVANLVQLPVIRIEVEFVGCDLLGFSNRHHAIWVCEALERISNVISAVVFLLTVISILIDASINPSRDRMRKIANYANIISRI
jgi:hypothetical protein